MNAVAPRRTLSAAAEEILAERFKLGGLALFVLAAWMLQHPYAGLVHDSAIYTLLALARLHPHSLSHDMFLRFGSQDRYTLFSPIYAEAIRLLDLDPAAALLTLVSQIAFFGFFYLFARRFMPASLALLGVGLLAVLPTDYGSYEVFHSTEDFLTPRLPAAGLVLAGLAATFASRRLLGALCLLAAIVLHPIIGSAGIALLFCMFVAIPRPRLALAIGVGCLLVSLLPLLVIHSGVFSRLDPQWYQVVRSSSPFLFPTAWSVRDWSRASVPLAVLASGLLTSRDERLRTLCAASLLIAAGGIVLTMVYCDSLRVVLVTEMQLWRWLWLASVVAIGFSPLIARDCWKRNTSLRAVPVLLASACVLRGEPVALGLSLMAVACAAAGHRITNLRAARLVALGSGAIFIVAVSAYVARMSSYRPLNPITGSAGSVILQWLRDLGADGVTYATVLALLWRSSGRLRSLRGALLLAAFAVLACAALGPSAWKSWTPDYYTKPLYEKFAAWRRGIPQDAEVLWPETPVGAWYVLERPSYWSLYQVAGAVFSRSKAIELRRRERLIDAVLGKENAQGGAAAPSRRGSPPGPSFVSRLDARGLRLLCADPALDFYVSHGNLAPTPFAPIVLDPERPRVQLHLYRCADVRS